MNDYKNIYSLSNLGFAYSGSQPLFTGLTLNLPQQGVTVITGGNGSGKTTLCRLLTGLERGYQGSLKFCGKELSMIKESAITDKVLYVKQDLNGNLLGVIPDDDLKVWQNRFCEPDTDEKTEMRQDSLKMMNADSLISTPFWKLSYGQKRKTMLAVLPLFPDRYWIIDEPTASLDGKGIERLTEIIKNKVRKHCGCLITTHRASLFRQLIPECTICQIFDHQLEVQTKT